MNYRNFRKDIYSANGEDGVIEKIFEDLKIKTGVVCEFGAWDGLVSSNTANLWRNGKFSAILMESDEDRYNNLLNNVKGYDTQTFNIGISRSHNDVNSLDNVLKQSTYDLSNENFVLLSIDIDSYDYYVFESLQNYQPKVVIMEVSSGYLPNQDFLSDTDGCSIKSLYELAIEKKYTIVCHIGNAILVRDDLAHMLQNYEYSLDSVYTHLQDLVEYEKSQKK